MRGAHEDVLGGPDDDRRHTAARWVSLAVAVAVGFAAAQVIDSSSGADPDTSLGASLALVVGRQPYLSAVGDDAPETTMEVTLVNTGASTVRLGGAAVEGSELAWEADRSLKPGQQVAWVLREQHPCDREPDVLSGVATGRQQLQVRLQGAERGYGGSALSLSLGPTAGRLYDDHVREVCKLPRLPDALDLVQGGATVDGDELVVALGLLNLSVRPLRVVEVASSVPGLTGMLTDATGHPIALPLDVPARTRLQIAQGYDYDDPATTPYRLHLSATAPACKALRTATGGDGSMDVYYVDPEDPRKTAARPVFADLVQLFRRACA